jgi:hypothetical protein
MATNEEISNQVRAMARVLDDHIAREEQQRLDAFPNGDVHGHRAAHEAMIEAKQAEAQFWRELKIDVAKKGVWGILVVIVGLVMVGGLYTVAAKLGIAATTVKP